MLAQAFLVGSRTDDQQPWFHGRSVGALLEPAMQQGHSAQYVLMSLLPDQTRGRDDQRRIGIDRLPWELGKGACIDLRQAHLNALLLDAFEPQRQTRALAGG